MRCTSDDFQDFMKKRRRALSSGAFSRCKYRITVQRDVVEG